MGLAIGKHFVYNETELKIPEICRGFQSVLFVPQLIDKENP